MKRALAATGTAQNLWRNFLELLSTERWVIHFFRLMLQLYRFMVKCSFRGSVLPQFSQQRNVVSLSIKFPGRMHRDRSHWRNFTKFWYVGDWNWSPVHWNVMLLMLIHFNCRKFWRKLLFTSAIPVTTKAHKTFSHIGLMVAVLEMLKTETNVNGMTFHFIYILQKIYTNCAIRILTFWWKMQWAVIYVIIALRSFCSLFLHSIGNVRGHWKCQCSLRTKIFVHDLVLTP